MSAGPLHGVRIVDLTRVLAGPFSTMLLADFGADVIKIETPGNGDQIRHQGGMRHGLSWYFAGFNRNKRSITLNMRDPEGIKVLKTLLRDADVLVENFRPGVLDDMGLSQDILNELNPALVVCSISGYGQYGPYRNRPAFDFIAQATSGFMSATGYPGQAPLRAGLPVSDLVAGLYGALGVCAALLRREKDGKGERIDVALVDSILSFGSYFVAQYLATGEPMERSGNDHPVVAPYGLFNASDGYLAIAPSNDRIYERLVEALEIEDELSHEDFKSNEARMRNRERVNAILNRRIGEQTREFWIERLNAAGVPCSAVQSYADALSDPQIRAREMVIEVEHPGRGPVKMIGFPVKFKQAPCEVRLPAPEMGSHTRAVLEEIGYDERAIAELERVGVVS